jgi:hypothetical protein
MLDDAFAALKFFKIKRNRVMAQRAQRRHGVAQSFFEPYKAYEGI